MSRKIKTALARKIIKVTDENIDDEQLIHELLAEDIYISNDDKELSFGDKSADILAKFAGSWVFIISFCVFLLGWIVVNLYLLKKPFDPYPFILLNLILSCLASIQAPLIMMSQNRQEEKDRRRSESDYRTGLKTEIIIEDMHYKIDKIIAMQEQQFSKVEKCVTRIEKEE